MRYGILLFLILSFFRAVPAVALDVMEIVKKANHVSYYQGNDGRAKVTMRITDSQGRERVREFIILRRNEGKADGEQRFYVYFTKPADVKKMVFMVIKNMDRGDDRWLYLPALDLVKRIAASDERSSFVGSNFFYEDVSGRGVDEDAHEIVGEDDTYYVIKNTPKDPDAVEFSFYKSWIDKTTFLPVKAEYYNTAGKLLRRYTALEVEMISGYPTVTASRMEDIGTGSKTLMTYSALKYDVGLPDNIFTERYLRKAPRKYLR